MNYEMKKYSEDDFDFVYNAKKNAYQKYVEANWGTWDDAIQKELFKKFIDAYQENIYMVQVNKKNIGFYNGEILEDGSYEIGNIVIIPEYQGQKIGTKILKNILEQYKNKDIHIQYFKQNPVGTLYERFGYSRW